MENDTPLTDDQKKALRETLVAEAKKLLGIPYVYGAEWVDFSKPPAALDCSELVEGVYHNTKLKMPDGGQQQFNFTVPAATPKPGDLAFFGKNGKIEQVYHVGLIFDDKDIIEARGHQPESKFETGKVILRPRTNWENYKPNFLGYRSHPKLA